MRVLRKVGLTGGKGLKSITTLQWCFIPVIPYFPETQQFDYAPWSFLVACTKDIIKDPSWMWEKLSNATQHDSFLREEETENKPLLSLHPTSSPSSFSKWLFYCKVMYLSNEGTIANWLIPKQ